MWKKTLLLSAGAGIIVGSIAFYTAFQMFGKENDNTSVEKNAKEAREEVSKKPVPAEAEGVPENNHKEQTVPANTEEKITSETKIIYQYYYPEDDLLEEQSENAPYYLIDATLTKLQEYYDDWQIVSFSAKEVILRKVVEGKSAQRYVIGIQDGYVAVFYEEEQNGVSIKEVTDTPISSLSHEEQIRLNDGIFVVGEDNLSKILEDYGS